MTLELDGVVKSYPGFDVGPLDLSVADEVLAVLGPSGSGKTTLLSVIAGIARPDAGSISLDGRELVGRPLEDRRVGLVFQDGALFPHLTARENVDYAATGPERTEELAAMLEISDVLDRRPKSLSGGERQRVALARTLAADPDVLLLDEPLSSLDAPIQRRLREKLHDLFGSLDIPVVYVTHDQRAATVLGDRIAVLHDGGIEQVGSPSAILHRPRTEFAARFTGSENVFPVEVTRRDGNDALLRTGDLVLRARTDLGPPAGATASVCVRPSRIRLERDANAEAGGDPDLGPNTVTGTIRRGLNEGDEYRVCVALDAADLELTARVPSAAFERLGAGEGSTVRVSIDRDAIHLLGGPA
ncbi:ABC transporter ATP-binding protein [Salinigranum sp. GCM10025319]|uniref:ABC transporter ATP-binding protein n=1 Tax=Salinigranum sp. GCM10025319 TaxID=3252687 RepID=UPI003621AAB5